MFYRADDPTSSVKTLKEGGLVIQTGLSLTRLTSPCYSNTTCMYIWYKTVETKANKSNTEKETSAQW